MQALEGIRILDLTRLLPGPFCTMLLADFGADVIKIEQPGEGDYARLYPPLHKGMGYRHIIVNRNKRSLALDLKTPEGKEVFYQLAADADVVVESFRPGVVKRLGIDYEKICQINPRIVYCSISGYGQTGPYKMEAGHDLNYVSLGGVTSLTGPRDGKPSIPGIQIADLGGGLTAATGILLALLARNKTGKGQYIDISLHDSVVGLLASDASNYFGLGVATKRGESRLTGLLPNYNCYQTKDGKYLAVGALEQKFWDRLCEAIERPDLKDAINDEQKREYLFGVLETTFAAKELAEWEKIFEGKDACVTAVKDLEEVFNDPHVRERKMILEVDDEKLGRHQQLGMPIKLSDTPGSIRSSAPALGEHTEEILQEIAKKKGK